MKSLKSCAMALVFLSSFCFWTVWEIHNISAEEESSTSEDFSIISMEFDGAPLKDVLKVLSQQSGLNFIASEEIQTKKVTVFFDHVPVQDALESIVKANGFRYEKKGGSVYVIYAGASEAGVPMQTRVIHLKYARVSTSPLDVGGGSTIRELVNPEQLAALGSGGGGQKAGTEDKAGKKEEKKNLFAERGIDKLVASLLSENGKVAVDLASNSLVVTDTADTLNEIERIIAKLDVPSREVMLEVHLMEVKKNILDDEGLEWGGTDGALASLTAGSRTTGFPFTENIFNKSKGVKATTQGTSTLTLGTLSAANFKAVLHYVTTHTGTKILAQPRVLTLNNEAASIRLVTNTAVAKTSTLSASEGISTLQTGGAERTAVGIILKITPQVNDDQSVGLFVEPSVTTVAASTFFPSDFLDPTTRVVRTMARVKNDETLVIGGLVDSDKTVTKKKIPFLGDLPLVGKAFEYTHGNDADRELLIFITPHIVKGYDSLSDPSATTPGKELAVKRTLDAFVQDEYLRNLDPLENWGKENAPALNQEKELMVKNAKDIMTPNAEKAMSQALESTGSKNSKTKSF